MEQGGDALMREPGGGLPTGTVTLLFTDIEGSTQHWEQRRAAMASVLRRHDGLLRNAIEAHGGRVFKTVGDEFCAAFWRASDGVMAAIEAQRALSAEDWSAVGELRVRMALHSGSTDERDGDYYGPAVNRVARLLSTAHGGQVVVSGATGQLLRGEMPEQTELRDLGEHRLKDLIEPEHVWQLIAAGLPDTFPPLRSLDSLPNNLPRQLTPLIGRDDVLAEVEALVNDNPLVTLVGTGGVGKTRVALQVGADLLDGSGDGVWFIELAPLGDPSLVVPTIATALGVREQPERPLFQTLLHYLTRKRVLLILDNCEHVVEEVARIADSVLRDCPEARLLATSREPLRIAGEHVYRIPSLGVPREGEITAEAALRYGSVALFVERATASAAKFMLTDESAPVVAEICRRLDGIALAIELAAARVKMLAPRQLAQKLDERFRVLTGGSRTALPRQQTMLALIDWSHDLLSPKERRLFRRVAIFAGGWTLDAAGAVCADEDDPTDAIESWEVLDLLTSLVDKSLVVVEAAGEDRRYRLLESMRQYASEKLAQTEERFVLARRHAVWAADLGDQARDMGRKVWDPFWFTRFEPELDNARAAIDWALSAGLVSTAAHVAAGFAYVWEASRGRAEPCRWLDAVLPGLDAVAEAEVGAHAWRALAHLSFGSKAIQASQRAFELYERCDDSVGKVLSLEAMAVALARAGSAEAGEAATTRALQICKASGLTRSLAYANVLERRGVIATSRNRFDEARQLHAEALSLRIALGSEYQAVLSRLHMAELEFTARDPKRALEIAEAAVVAAQRARATYLEWIAQANGAAYRLALGDVDGARSTAREALALTRGRWPLEAAIAMQHLATVAALRGDARRGARLRGYVDARYVSEGCEREATERVTDEILMASLRKQLTEAEIEALGAKGAQLLEEQAVAEAIEA
ncbi:MAG: adenylate/guanylate cyclase domain-containing protein [Candidatus Eremiobacteraeota bacterium]|nr:adenylate/guanylate cyclase domain-containing protein [Candidatus Eremiobacteraeota bacterium]